jgi:hypothetical protein
MSTTKIRIDFGSDTCLYGLVITKEYYDENRISYVEVIYKENTLTSEVVIDPRVILVNESRLETIGYR